MLDSRCGLPSDLLLNGFMISLGKEREKGTTEEVCVTIRISQLISNCIKK